MPGRSRRRFAGPPTPRRGRDQTISWLTITNSAPEARRALTVRAVLRGVRVDRSATTRPPIAAIQMTIPDGASAIASIIAQQDRRQAVPLRSANETTLVVAGQPRGARG